MYLFTQAVLLHIYYAEGAAHREEMRAVAIELVGNGALGMMICPDNSTRRTC